MTTIDNRRRRGRPRADRRAALLGWLDQHPSFTMGQLSRSLGWPILDTAKTLHRAQVAGEVRDSGLRIKTSEAKRPVVLYERVGAEPNAVPLASLLRVWT